MFVLMSFYCLKVAVARREEIIKRQDEAIRSLEVKDFIPTRRRYNHSSSFEKMMNGVLHVTVFVEFLTIIL